MSRDWYPILAKTEQHFGIIANWKWDPLRISTKHQEMFRTLTLNDSISSFLKYKMTMANASNTKVNDRFCLVIEIQSLL